MMGAWLLDWTSVRHMIIWIGRAMFKLGFNDQWVHQMSMCVEIVSYSVLVNNEQVCHVILGRGLRQGDHNYPYLFIICAEGLSLLIRCAEVGGDLEGTSIFRVAPPISHLLFPDDYFLFYKAEQRQAQTMQNIFKMYKESSGQFISMPKSKIFYSRNVPVDLTNSIKNIMGVQEVHDTKKCLGLPSMI